MKLALKDYLGQPVTVDFDFVPQYCPYIEDPNQTIVHFLDDTHIRLNIKYETLNRKLGVQKCLTKNLQNS